MPSPAVALFTYNRPRHTRAVLEALERCGVDHLYVFQDGLAARHPTAPHREVTELIAGIGFCPTTVARREKNAGLAASIIAGVTEVLREHETIIVLEDDCVPAPQFLALMSELLRRLATRERVFSVSGYALPAFPDDYPYDVCFAPLSSSWGWATWRDRWAKFDARAEGWPEVLKDRAQRLRFEAPGARFSTMLRMQMNGEVDSWAIRWYFTLFKHGGVCAWPLRSFIRNIGLDGSGTHTGKAPMLEAPGTGQLDLATLRIPPGLEFDPRIAAAFRNTWPGRTLGGTLRALVRPSAWVSLARRLAR